MINYGQIYSYEASEVKEEGIKWKRILKMQTMKPR